MTRKEVFAVATPTNKMLTRNLSKARIGPKMALDATDAAVPTGCLLRPAVREGSHGSLLKVGEQTLKVE